MESAMNLRVLLAALPLVAVASGATAQARDQIRIVGSTTIQPLMQAAGEQFVKATRERFKAPAVTASSTGAGIRQFCAGTGANHPDIAMASRRMDKAEYETCAKNGVGGITEIKFGIDGIILAQSKGGAVFDLTLREIYLALAKTVPEGNKEGGKLVPNPNKTWKDVNSTFPATKIEVYGTAAGHATRALFIEVAVAGGCRTFAEFARLQGAAFDAACRSVREDEAWKGSFEKDDDVAKALLQRVDAVGIVTYRTHLDNDEKLDAKRIDGIEAKSSHISSGHYKLARPMYIYVKKAHVASVVGLKDFVAHFASPAATGRRGYLVREGLIPLPETEWSATESAAQELPDLRM
jgi:phosphate transport system substrate-binding protein